MANYDHVEIIDGDEIPFKIYIERRNSVRVSFGRSCINLRMPSSLAKSAREKHLRDAVDWVKRHADKTPSALANYISKNYDELDHIEIYGQKLGINVQYQDRKTGRGDFDRKNNSVSLLIPVKIEGQQKHKMIKHLLSRVCGNLFLPDITKRVMDINDKCFHKEIKSVNLKYNKSNWGSCSTALNVNLSTRLLFAPMDVIDYVIVHELAHLYEMNHSDKFWNIVRQVMPNYKEKEAWLKKYGIDCDF